MPWQLLLPPSHLHFLWFSSGFGPVPLRICLVLSFLMFPLCGRPLPSQAPSIMLDTLPGHWTFSRMSTSVLNSSPEAHTDFYPLLHIPPWYQSFRTGFQFWLSCLFSRKHLVVTKPCWFSFHDINYIPTHNKVNGTLFTFSSTTFLKPLMSSLPLISITVYQHII